MAHSMTDLLIGARRKCRVTQWCERPDCENALEIVFDDINIVEDDIMEVAEERGWQWTAKISYYCPDHAP